jgi:DNA-directed RNA polymerase specialized sigma24 family protein
MTSHSWQSVTEHRAYLFRAVFNEALGTKRSDHRRCARETTAAPHEDVETTYVRIEVADAMSQLSVRQRSVLFLAYWLDLTVRRLPEPWCCLAEAPNAPSRPRAVSWRSSSDEPPMAT